jgi:hypothetical protein
MPKCPNCSFTWGNKGLKDRSNPQNRYLHGVLLPVLSTHTGYDQDEMKAVIKWKFKVQHTSALSTIEFEKFLSDVREWASRDLGCYLPCPNEHPVIV